MGERTFGLFVPAHYHHHHHRRRHHHHQSKASIGLYYDFNASSFYWLVKTRKVLRVVYVARMKQIMIAFAVLLGRPDSKVLLRGLAGYERWAIEGAEFLDRLISCLRERILLQRLCSVTM
jgi:hypothetical protein